MLRLFNIVNLLLAVLFITGCATIFTGTTDKISFSSNVDPVRVYMDGQNVGVTPLELVLNRRTQKGPKVRFVKDGYETQEFTLIQKFNMVAVLDVFSIITSGGIDVLSGSIMEYSPKQYHIEMIDNKQISKERSSQLDFTKFVLVNSIKIQEDLAKGGGEYSHALVDIVGGQSSSGNKFEEWMSQNMDFLVSSASPDMLLKNLRSSQMTP